MDDKGLVIVHATFANLEPSETEQAGRRLSPFDYDQKLTQLSWMENGRSQHLILAPGPTTGATTWEFEENQHVTLCDSESSMLVRFWEMVTKLSDAPYYTLLAGWGLRESIWPKLVTRALALRIKVPKELRADLFSRWNNNKALLEVSDIYRQGAYQREIPPLDQVLRYFDIPSCEDGFQLETLHALTEAQWVGNALGVNGLSALMCFMRGQHELIKRYYE